MIQVYEWCIDIESFTMVSLKYPTQSVMTEKENTYKRITLEVVFYNESSIQRGRKHHNPKNIL
jgi:hypothetical protein